MDRKWELKIRETTLLISFCNFIFAGKTKKERKIQADKVKKAKDKELKQKEESRDFHEESEKFSAPCTENENWKLEEQSY